jgi:hypothetical protein
VFHAVATFLVDAVTVRGGTAQYRAGTSDRCAARRYPKDREATGRSDP